jgi:hypothetical protein
MGKRSRKRASDGAAPSRRPVAPSPAGGRPTPSRHAAPVDRRARLQQAPPAPWSPFPLVELSILAGLICIVVGFFAGGGSRGLLLVLGFALVSISAVELSIREHFAGFRSHTTLLSAMLAIAPIVPLYLATSLPQVVLLIVGVVVFLVAFGALRAMFMRRTGGLGFRV